MARLKEMLGTKPEVAAKEKWRKWDRCWCVAGEGEQGLCVRRAQRHHGYQVRTPHCPLQFPVGLFLPLTSFSIRTFALFAARIASC